jgi:hypothetical protein
MIDKASPGSLGVEGMRYHRQRRRDGAQSKSGRFIGNLGV